MTIFDQTWVQLVFVFLLGVCTGLVLSDVGRFKG
jgi:hypothetical protein